MSHTRRLQDIKRHYLEQGDVAGYIEALETHYANLDASRAKAWKKAEDLIETVRALSRKWNSERPIHHLNCRRCQAEFTTQDPKKYYWCRSCYVSYREQCRTERRQIALKEFEGNLK